MTIFAGGARHGTEWEPPKSAGTGPMVMTGGATAPASPPKSFVDAATGDQYGLVEVTFQLPHPITGQPDQVWTNTVYLHASLAADPNAGMAALQDAVTRWWFKTSGTHKALSTPDKNGHGTAGVRYVAHCAECQQRELPGHTQQFDNLGSRALWMTGHIEATGHKVTWTDEPQGVVDVRQD